MERDEASVVTSDEVLRATPFRQYQRFRRGIVWTPREFALTGVRRGSEGLNFSMRGETVEYVLRAEYASPSSPSRLLELSCSCPDTYQGLCKHLCWMVFKVLKHDDLDVFRTQRIPSVLGALDLDDADAQMSIVDLWSGGGNSFRGIPDSELSFAAWTPPRGCPFGDPGVWPPPHLDCAICFDDMEREGAKQCPKCHNCFHDACIGRWFCQKRSCPLCREPCIESSSHLF